MTDRILERLLEMLQFGLLASLGGLANYLYITVHQERKFSFWMMLVNLLLAFYVGNVAGSFMPEASSYRDGVLMAAGFCTYPILAFVENRFQRVLSIVFDRWFNKWLDANVPAGKRNEPEE